MIIENGMDVMKLYHKIDDLRQKRNAVIVAHYYQNDDVQEIADVVGDSFALAKYCASTDKDVIVFCGVHFMAESANILSPQKTVLLPVIDAGCPMADTAAVEDLKLIKSHYPNAAVVSYVNTTAEIKAESDVCCTSSNAVKIVKSLAEDEIIFVPDQNLGSYVEKQVPEKKFIKWQGCCMVHHRMQAEVVEEAKEKMPGVPILVHPECRPEVVEKADFVGSTKQIIEYATKSEAGEFLIGTEKGILYELKKRNPNKKFHLLSQSLLCKDMKKTNLKDVYYSLKNMEYEIRVEEDIRVKAQRALDRMLELG